jgi:hypothetical protein
MFGYSYGVSIQLLLPLPVINTATSFTGASEKDCLIFDFVVLKMLFDFRLNYSIEQHCVLWGARGSVVVKALCYKLEGRGFYTR